MTFEEYLRAAYKKEHRGYDDNMANSFTNWLCCLGVDDWITYGDQFACKKSLNSLDKVSKKIKTVFR